MSQSEAYGIVIAKDRMVPMRDGVRLATDVYRPACDGEALAGRWPTILGRTSYDKESPWMWVDPVAKYFVPRGFVVVLQDLRGRHRSEGKGQYNHVVNDHEGRDGYDTVEWIAAQSWSNGRVGTVGVSHGAVVQAALAIERPPHLAAMWLDDGFWNWFTNGARQGGALELDTLGMMFLHGHDSQEAREEPVIARAMAEAAQGLRDWVLQMPLKRGCSPLALIPALEDIFFDYFGRGEEDDFWRQPCINFERYLDRFADVPTALRCGWYDVFALANGGIYPRLRQRLSSPVQLIMGPWVHNGATRSWAGQIDFGPAASLDGQASPSLQELQLAWFSRWLGTSRPAGAVSRPAGAADSPTGQAGGRVGGSSGSAGWELGDETAGCVRLFVMGGGSGRRTAEGRLDHGGHWRTEQQWPPATTVATTFYLGDQGALSLTPPGPTTEPAGYTFDPAHPVPTISGNLASFYEHLPVPEGISPALSPPRARMRSIVLMGGSHQQEAPEIVGCRAPYPRLAARPDILVFQTPPLTTDTEVTGMVTARLWIASSAPDTDFTAKLIDVYPPSPDYPQGFDLNLADGIIRCRYRDGYDQARFMTAGMIYPITIELGPTSNLFKAGHRIRLDISSSNFPRFDVNPNTGEALEAPTHRQVAHNRVFRDAAHPSQVILPIVMPLQERPV